MAKNIAHTTVEYLGITVPVEIYRERRRSVRYAFGKKAVILRMPTRMYAKSEQEVFQDFLKWTHKKFRENPNLIYQYEEKSYKDGQELIVGKRKYTLRLSYEDRKTNRAILDGKEIILMLSKHMDEAELLEKIPNLISKAVAEDFMPEIERRIDDMNDQFFQQNIHGVELNYTHSKWGSCSKDGVIKLSTRLLFAPDPVIDYLIIHELSHLIEFNHSKEFWALVSGAMPDYKQKIKWLKANGGLCRF